MVQSHSFSCTGSGAEQIAQVGQHWFKVADNPFTDNSPLIISKPSEMAHSPPELTCYSVALLLPGDLPFPFLNTQLNSRIQSLLCWAVSMYKAWAGGFEIPTHMKPNPPAQFAQSLDLTNSVIRRTFSLVCHKRNKIHSCNRTAVGLLTFDIKSKLRVSLEISPLTDRIAHKLQALLFCIW